MGDIFDMFGSPYTADEWLSHMKLTIDEIFTKEGSPVPPEVAKVYNDLEAYSKQLIVSATTLLSPLVYSSLGSKQCDAN